MPQGTPVVRWWICGFYKRRKRDEHRATRLPRRLACSISPTVRFVAFFPDLSSVQYSPPKFSESSSTEVTRPTLPLSARMGPKRRMEGRTPHCISLTMGAGEPAHGRARTQTALPELAWMVCIILHRYYALLVSMGPAKHRFIRSILGAIPFRSVDFRCVTAQRLRMQLFLRPCQGATLADISSS